MTDATTAAADALGHVSTKFDNMLKNETFMININVFFSLLSRLSPVSYDRKLVKKILHR